MKYDLVDPGAAAWLALQAAVADIPGEDGWASLQAATEEIPVALGVEFANLRLLSPDRELHLVSACGCTLMEIRKRAHDPLALVRVRERVDSGEHAKLGLSLGIQWMKVVWLRGDGDLVGSLAVGCRTRRRPSDEQLVRLAEITGRLGERVVHVERGPAALRAASVRLAREWTVPEWASDGRASELRPREQTILELYADGLATAEIAALLFISPHTVRTHVKLAMRRLGVHTRDEAAAIVRADQLAQLL